MSKENDIEIRYLASRNLTRKEIAKEIGIEYEKVRYFIAHKKIHCKTERIRNGEPAIVRNVNKFNYIMGIISEIKDMQTLKGGWRQIEQFNGVITHKELLIDALLNRREELLNN